MSEREPSPFESGPRMRTREEALAWVKKHLTSMFVAGVLEEGVLESGQVEVHKELHDVDYRAFPECAPVTGVQLALGKLEDLLEEARREGTMPFEEEYLGLCITYLRGVEQEVHSMSDMIGLEEKTPGMSELTNTLEHARADILNLRDMTFQEKEAA